MNGKERKTVRICRIGRTAAFLCLGILLITSRPGQSQSPQASPLPLSGRAGQSGSVTAVEAPIAGTTDSVTTINPTIQVQGPYAGSASSTAKLPFSGKLSLREAIERGLNYNLGAVGQNNAVRQAKGRVRLRAAPCFPMSAAIWPRRFNRPILRRKGFASQSRALPSRRSSDPLTISICGAASLNRSST